MVWPAPTVALVGQLYAVLIWSGESPNGEEAPGPVASAKQFAPLIGPGEHEMLEAERAVALAINGIADARIAAGKATPRSQMRREPPSP
jgi:hypothetical protein